MSDLGRKDASVPSQIVGADEQLIADVESENGSSCLAVKVCNDTDQAQETQLTILQCLVDEQKQTNKLLRLILGYDLDATF